MADSPPATTAIADLYEMGADDDNNEEEKEMDFHKAYGALLRVSLPLGTFTYLAA